MGIPPPIEQANLGMADSLILMVLALVVFGPRRLPQIGRQIGKLMYEFRKASNDFKFQMEEELRNAEDADRRKREETERQRTLALNPPPQTTGTVTLAAPAEEPETAGTADSEAASPAPEASSNSSEIPLSHESTGRDLSAQDAPPEEGPLRVQPPSTGATVAAARPGAAKIEGIETSPAPAAEKSSAEADTAGEESSTATEQAAHNG